MYRVMLLKGVKQGIPPVPWQVGMTQLEAEAEADRVATMLRQQRLGGFALVVDERDRIVYSGTDQHEF